MEGDGKEPETIDVWELMKDLDEDDNLPDSNQPMAASLSKQSTSAKFSLDSLTLEPSDVTEVPQWLSSFQAYSAMGRSFASPAEGSSRYVPTYGKALNKHASMGGSNSHTAELLNVKLAGPTQETLAEHLQRSLSFETSPKMEMKRIFGQKDAMNAYYGKGLKLGVDADASSFSSSQLPWEGESISSPSTPSFSESARLKKWLHEDVGRSKTRQEQRAASGQSKLPTYQVSPPLVARSKLPTHQVSPPLAHSSKVLESINKVPVGSQNMCGYVRHDVDVGAGRKPRNHHVLTDHISYHKSGDRQVAPDQMPYHKPGIYPVAADQMPYHKPGIHHAATEQMPYMGFDQAQGVPEQSRARRVRHSFTAANRNKDPSDLRNFPASNRSSSLELDKAAPKVRVVLYSTSSKADVHAFEDSNAARAILASLVGASFEEKSVSQHPEYEQELKRALNTESALVPTVFVKRRYITGLDNIMQMFKKGVLRSLVAESMAEEVKPNAPCICRGGKFLICPICKGKRKLARREGEDDALCRHCSATGLIKCPNCINS